jgi:hypothetical protein
MKMLSGGITSQFLAGNSVSCNATEGKHTTPREHRAIFVAGVLFALMVARLTARLLGITSEEAN